MFLLKMYQGFYQQGNHYINNDRLKMVYILVITDLKYLETAVIF